MCLIPYLRTKAFCINCDISCKDSGFFRRRFSDLQLGEGKPDSLCIGYWLAKGSWRPQFSVCGECCFPRSSLPTALLNPTLHCWTWCLRERVSFSTESASCPAAPGLGNSGLLASQGWDGNPSTALPPVNVAPVLITYLFQESGAYYLLRLCRALLGESAFYTTLRFLFPPLCKVLWHSSFYLSSPKRVSKVSWHPVLWCCFSCSLCLCQVIYIPP